MAASLAVFVRCFVDRVRSGEGRASFGRLAGLAQLGRRRGQRPVRRMGIWTLGRTHCRSDTHGRGRKARLVCSLADVYTRLHAPTCIYMHLHAPTRTYTHLHASTYSAGRNRTAAALNILGREPPGPRAYFLPVEKFLKCANFVRLKYFRPEAPGAARLAASVLLRQTEYTYTHLAVRLASRFSSLRRAGRRGRAFWAWNRGPPC